MPRQQIEPRPLGHQAFARMQEQQVAALAALDQFEAGPRQRNRPGHFAASKFDTPFPRFDGNCGFCLTAAFTPNRSGPARNSRSLHTGFVFDTDHSSGESMSIRRGMLMNTSLPPWGWNKARKYASRSVCDFRP
jgi:hypothetical protein